MDKLAYELPVILWTVWTFILGTAVGSLLNVCIARLPMEKSILWPMSRCGVCFQSIRWYDNIPLLSYWILGGKCRTCRATFSIRYFLVELGTGLAFAGLFYLEIVANIHQMPFFVQQRWNIANGSVPWQAWVFFGYHAMLVSLLIVAAACDLERREIPLSLTMFGTGFGLIGSAFVPWPWPNDLASALPHPPNVEWWLSDLGSIGLGLYPWPFWGPLPEWIPLGSARAGFATGLVGLLVGTLMLRGVRAVFTRGLGREALGLGDADLMMMAGAFLGWQPVVVAFFLGAVISLGFAIVQLIVYRDTSLPFGPGLAVGIVITWLCWRSIAPAVQPIFFSTFFLAICVFGGAGFMLLTSVLFRLGRGKPTPESMK